MHKKHENPLNCHQRAEGDEMSPLSELPPETELTRPTEKPLGSGFATASAVLAGLATRGNGVRTGTTTKGSPACCAVGRGSASSGTVCCPRAATLTPPTFGATASVFGACWRETGVYKADLFLLPIPALPGSIQPKFRYEMSSNTQTDAGGVVHRRRGIVASGRPG